MLPGVFARVLSSVLLAGGLGTLACGRERTPGASNSATTAALAEAEGARALAEATAFDLTVSDRGAVLAWATARPAQLRVARFDAQGDAQTSSALPLAAKSVSDLAVAAGAQGLSAIWRETTGGEATARGVWFEAAGASRPLELGAAWAEPQAGRGNLSLVARGAGSLALVRGPREACEDGSDEACFGFRFYTLSPSGALETGLRMRVPVPCDAHAAQLVSPLPTPGAAAGTEPRLIYAVCTRAEQAPVLTVFSIEPERSYASAQPLFSGCTPLGAGYFSGQPMIVAECQGSRQIARVPGADAPFEIQSLDVRGLVCSARGARLRLGSSWLELDRPVDRLELLLDASLSPAGARAVWSGSVLLVARAQGGRLTLDRYGCSGSELRQLSSPLD